MLCLQSPLVENQGNSHGDDFRIHIFSSIRNFPCFSKTEPFAADPELNLYMLFVLFPFTCLNHVKIRFEHAFLSLKKQKTKSIPTNLHL